MVSHLTYMGIRFVFFDLGGALSSRWAGWLGDQLSSIQSPENQWLVSDAFPVEFSPGKKNIVVILTYMGIKPYIEDFIASNHWQNWMISEVEHI